MLPLRPGNTALEAVEPLSRQYTRREPRVLLDHWSGQLPSNGAVSWPFSRSGSKQRVNVSWTDQFQWEFGRLFSCLLFAAAPD